MDTVKSCLELQPSHHNFKLWFLNIFFGEIPFLDMNCCFLAHLLRRSATSDNFYMLVLHRPSTVLHANFFYFHSGKEVMICPVISGHFWTVQRLFCWVFDDSSCHLVMLSWRTYAHVFSLCRNVLYIVFLSGQINF